ncbi:universal stress protein [Sphingomonas sp. TDK1]|uniref:universal stress protein n=1 Tax=Sphingomonas sp. TDK1 TaxID=453247 RepID=UPI0007D91F50|nr:universal stress protein [Sphingomonas sp. TDK1]OAN67281.1 universal stress protein UspA [Sphingomonas sp. TDK1]
MKNVLVLMHDDAGQEARFQAALDLARGLEGHLRCVDIAMVPAYVGDYVEFGGGAALLADEQTREAANRVRMEGRLKTEDVPYDWVDATGFARECLRDATALADIVVLNRALDKIAYPDMRDLICDTILRTGKPIVAVPEGMIGFDLYGHAVVAWDGSRAAEAALQAAVPLLKHAGTVTILVVDEGALRLSATEAAEYLARHGIRPEVQTVPKTDTVAGAILAKVEAVRAAYLVMGGFGHSRLLEAAFGGVTRRMLAESPVALVMAH